MQRKPEGDEEETIQTKEDGAPATALSNVETGISSLKGHGQPLPASTRSFFEPRFGADFSRVRVSIDSKAAQTAKSINAKAYTKGTNIVFGSGEYQPETPSGRGLLAHELTHVVQQRGRDTTNLRGVIQRRRLPAQTTQLIRFMRKWHKNRPAYRFGLKRLVEMALEEMGPKEKAVIKKNARQGMSTRKFERLLKWKQYLRLAKAIYKSNAKYRLGDPRKHEEKAGSHAKMRILYANVIRYLKKIYKTNTRQHNDSIKQVFGKRAGTVRRVKKSFERAWIALRIMYPNSVFIDESGYMKEVGVPGEGSATSIVLSSEIVDKPNTANSIAVAIHESLHAGNKNIIDAGGYNDGGKRFREVSRALKLNNAAHYTVIAWRMLQGNNKKSHMGATFTPAKRIITSATSQKNALDIAYIDGANKANNVLEDAFQAADKLHELYRDIYKYPISWTHKIIKTGLPKKARYCNTLPYWSKVENLTIHKKKIIKLMGPDQRVRPVSAMDLAISEGIVRKLNQARNFIPSKPTKIKKFIKQHASSRQRLAALKSVPKTRNLIVKLILRKKLPNMIGKSSGNFKSVTQLARGYGKGNYSLIVAPGSLKPCSRP